MPSEPTAPKRGHGQVTRRALVGELTMSFAKVGSEARRLVMGGRLTGLDNSRVLVAGLVAAIACELEGGVLLLCENRCAYPAAALARQLVEVEYVAWASSRAPEEAHEWLTSTREQRFARWQPSQIRRRSNGLFPNTDYPDHCEQGGHATPNGAREILDNRDLWTEVCLYEAALHGANTWHYLWEAFAAVGVIEEIEFAHLVVDQAIARWRRFDPFIQAPKAPEGPADTTP